MRLISAASLAKLSQKTGTEPVNVIEVDFVNSASSRTVGPLSVYGDRSFPRDGTTPNIEPRILNMDSIQDILNISKRGTSQSVTITLDDSDGALKDKFNNVDLHKKRVWIYQWFSGIAYREKFLLFAGVITSPISWKEGDRTLTFSVTSQVEDQEVGFSPEEGIFQSLPENMVGTTWPIIFGQVAKLPLLLVDDIPSRDDSGDNSDSITKEPTGIEDPAIKPHLAETEQQVISAAQLAQRYFVGYLMASGRARREGELEEFDPIQKGKGKWSSLAKQYLNLGNQALLASQTQRNKNNEIKAVQQKQQAYEKKEIGITNGANMPQGKKLRLNLNGSIHEGYFLGDQFTVTARTHPSFERYDGIVTVDPMSDQMSTIPRDSYFFADAGTPATFSFLPGDQTEDQETHYVSVRYIVSAYIQVQVNTVYAMRTLNEKRGLYAIPSNYYQVVQTVFGSLLVTMLYLPQPLSTRVDSTGKSEGWGDEVWATVTSPVGPNTVDILKWLIINWTPHNIDLASFDAVRALLAPYPSNFAVTDRPQIISLLEDIAYQSRCVIWLKDNVFYLKYRSKKDPPVAVITQADIIEQTLEVSYTETEDLVTKYVALWKSDYKQSKDNKIVYRYNVQYYGLNEQSHNFFIYNFQSLVEKSATFWLIREANTFKYCSFKVPIKFLNIETLDTITLNFNRPFIANGPIDCVVEEAVLDTTDYTIQIKCWCPVRAGEMSEYLFCYLNDLGVQYIFPTEKDESDGRVTDKGVTEPAKDPAKPNESKPFSGASGNGGQVNITYRPHTWGSPPEVMRDQGNTAPAFTSRIDTTTIKAIGKKPEGTTKYQFTKLAPLKEITPSVLPTTGPGNVFPGFVVSGNGKGPYTVKVYKAGIDGESEDLTTVFALQMDADEQIPLDTAVMVLATPLESGDTEYTMQPPVWL